MDSFHLGARGLTGHAENTEVRCVLWYVLSGWVGTLYYYCQQAAANQQKNAKAILLQAVLICC
jgi:hypothetical protein